MKTISRYIMTLALLITAATGAWAQTTVTWTEADLTGSGSDLTTYTKDGVTIKCSDRISSGKSFNGPVTISTTLGNFTKIEITGQGSAPIQSDIFTNDGNVSTWTGNAASLNFPNAIAYATQFVFTIAPAGPEVTITGTSAEGQQASFQMPQYDVTATYTIKRDISVDVTATMGDGTDGVRYRVKKSEQVPGKYEPAEMDMMQVLALVAVNDGIEQKALTLNQDYYCRIYKLDEQTQQPADDGVLLADFDFAPGLYALKAFAEKGSNYDGETALSNTFQLFEGYQVEVAAKEFITYYKDEPLYVEDEDAVLYTISSVNGDQAVLSDKSDAMPSNTPMLVYNKSNETKTFLLIPCAEPDMDITVAPEFVGTLEATTIAASTDDQTNYALNGKQFVWVKDAVEIGANKAWLSISNSNARAISFVFDETTGLSEELRVKSEEFATATWYTLDGRKIAAPTKKGIYIMNGRKVVVK